MHATREQSEIMGQADDCLGDNTETNPITIKPETTAMWQISSPGFPYLAALYLGPFCNKFLLVAQCASSDISKCE